VSYQDPLVVVLAKQRLEKGEKLYYLNSYGELMKITGFGHAEIDQQIPTKYSGPAAVVKMKGRADAIIAPPQEDEWDLRKVQDHWELAHVKTFKHFRDLKESDDMPMIARLVKQRLAKDEEVTLNINLRDFGGPLFRNQPNSHLGSIRSVGVENWMDCLSWGDGPYLGDDGSLDGDAGRPLLVFHYVKDASIRHIAHTGSGWVAMYADEADDKLDLHKTSYGWQLTNRLNESAGEDILTIDELVNQLIKRGKKVQWGWNSDEWITDVYREPGAKMIKVSYEMPNGWSGSTMLDSSQQKETELRKNGDHFSLVFLPMHAHRIKEQREDEPLTVQILRQRMSKGEKIYLPLGKLRYFLRSIEYKPGANEHWLLKFSERPETLITMRRVTWNNDGFWHLQKEVDGDRIMWRMTLEDVA